MLLQRWTPDSGLRPELGNLVESTLATPWTFDPWRAWMQRAPASPAPMIETQDDGVLVRVELPGVDPEAIDVQLVGDQLTIAVRAEGEADGRAAPHRFGAFRKTLRLPYEVDAEHVVATARHGVLSVELKKPADAMPKRIAVKGK